MQLETSSSEGELRPFQIQQAAKQHFMLVSCLLMQICLFFLCYSKAPTCSQICAVAIFHVLYCAHVINRLFMQEVFYHPVALKCGHVFCRTCACRAAHVHPKKPMGLAAALKTEHCPMCREVSRCLDRLAQQLHLQDPVNSEVGSILSQF